MFVPFLIGGTFIALCVLSSVLVKYWFAGLPGSSWWIDAILLSPIAIAVWPALGLSRLVRQRVRLTFMPDVRQVVVETGNNRHAPQALDYDKVRLVTASLTLISTRGVPSTRDCCICFALESAFVLLAGDGHAQFEKRLGDLGEQLRISIQPTSAVLVTRECFFD